jgi:hypothetical protein
MYAVQCTGAVTAPRPRVFVVSRESCRKWFTMDLHHARCTHHGMESDYAHAFASLSQAIRQIKIRTSTNGRAHFLFYP